jgi:3-phenylpropionate/cinnamic acid dioxygenase small subunit
MKSANISKLTSTKPSNSTSELSKFYGIPNFLSELVKIDPSKVKPIVKLLKGLMIHINDEIKTFKAGMDHAKGQLDQAIVTHKDKKSRFDVKAGTLKDTTTIYDTSKTQLNDAKIVKGVAETKYNDAKTAYETSVTELSDATKAKNGAETNYNDAKAAYDTSETQLTAATKVKDDAVVKHEDAKTAYDTNKPILLNNIKIIESIIAKLEEMSFALVRHVNSRDNTTRASWLKVCGKYGTVEVNSVMKITIGQYADYFKPVKAMTFCDFLLSDSFEWSVNPLGPYIKPKYYTGSNHYGGADYTWSKSNAGGRSHLPFWGIQNANHGGCCVSKPGESAWFLSFDMRLSKRALE